MIPPPKIQFVATRFNLYREMQQQNAANFQQMLTASGAQTDHGLRFAKFFGRWQASDTPELLKKLQTDERNRNGDLVAPKHTDPLLDWLDPRKTNDNYRIPGHKFETLKAGNKAQLISAHKRLKKLASGGAYFNLNLISRLLIGIGLPHPTENGMLFHPTLGVPYIPGSALKQVAHDYAEEEEGLSRDELDHFFGGPKHGAGCIAFLDGLPCQPVTLTAEQITNHYGGYYQNIDPAEPATNREDMHQPADWYEPNPVTMLAVDASFTTRLPFCFAILPLRAAADGDIEKVQEWLTKGLEIYGVGARTTVGFGRFESGKTRIEKQQAREAEARNAPPGIGDHVRILDTHKKARQRGKAGTISKIDEFGDVHVDTGGGGAIKTRFEHIEKV